MSMSPRVRGSTMTRRFAAALAAAIALGSALPVAAQWPAPKPLVTVDVYDRNDGAALPVYTKDGRRYVVGAPGHEYAVRIRNCTGERILAVASVDGVNVVSGETASPEQSGYVIDAWGSVEIAGWRKGLDRTAAFYFTDLGDSYAARTGRPGNVGVIGVAVFKEKPAPVAYQWPRDKIAADAAGERKDMPASAAAPAPMAEERNEQGQQAAKAAGALDSSARTLTSKLGTGHGRNETSYAQRVQFERASASPAETIAFQYDRRENLIAMGVLPSPRYAQRQPNPFPGMRFVPDPR